MIYVSEEYKKACESGSRTSYVIAKYGQFDKTIKGKIKKINTYDMQSFSNINKVYNDVRDTTFNYITCEPNRVRLNNTFYFISDKTKSNENEKIAFFGKTLSDSTGAIIKNGGGKGNAIEIRFSEIMLLNDILLHFQEVCEEMEITFGLTSSSSGGSITSVYRATIVGNKDLTYAVLIPEKYKNASYNYLNISFRKTAEPYRFAKLNEIDFGSFQTFTNQEIKDLEVIDELSIDSSELSSN